MSRPSFYVALLWVVISCSRACAETGYHILPEPASLQSRACSHPYLLRQGLRFGRNVDGAAFDLISERWKALGIAPPIRSAVSSVHFHKRNIGAQAYEMKIEAIGSIEISSEDADGAFYALMTLAQLPQRTERGWVLPCVWTRDAPALRWRVLSDDVSRGPLPTMRYFKERIRTIAAFKMNGYSPYMEHVFIDSHNPLPAPLDGITSEQLAELDQYAKRFHVVLIPEQQTFAHMHNTLRWERYAAAAELPHGYLMSPANALSLAYIKEVLDSELAVIPHPKFFHIGSDEPSDLGRGQTKALVEALGDASVYAQHVKAVAGILQASGTRPMIWDDAVQRNPAILAQIPKSVVIVNWHYGAEKTFLPNIQTIFGGGFDQMIAPGANNWNEIYPAIQTALPNENLFITEGKAAHVLGLFQTVWHDDGETLYEATWYPLIFAASSAWQQRSVDPRAYALDFTHAFFGSDDPRYGDDITTLGLIVAQLERDRSDSTNYLFWSDPFEARLQKRVASSIDLVRIRKEAEAVLEDLYVARPPLHENAVNVMALAARRFDVLARNYQIGSEARYYYDDARAHADGKQNRLVYRGLFIAKYLLWEMRDNFLELEPLYARAWDYESRSSHRASVLERYHLAARVAIARADAINAMTYEGYLHTQVFPSFDETMSAGPR
ncbi:MAG: beta-N-acetylhexosaminidase [Candidatus Eremiobacteraeota bacterium]|nr:beta-N-acetylhexosaminidase [Candidatus Eremiobacteraeota bacterium]